MLFMLGDAMCLLRTYNRGLLDDRMSSDVSYCSTSSRSDDMARRHGLQGDMQKLPQGNGVALPTYLGTQQILKYFLSQLSWQCPCCT